VLKKYSVSIKSNAAKEIKFSRSKINTYFKSNIGIENLFNQIIENILKLEPFLVKLQVKLMLDKNTAMVLVTEYCKFVLLLMKEPLKVFPSHYIELVWQTHVEFTDAYRNFCQTFYGEIKRLPNHYQEKKTANSRKYGFTKAEYERVFLEKPDEIIWENDELRFNQDYMRTPKPQNPKTPLRSSLFF
jgi:hypothetical protein